MTSSGAHAWLGPRDDLVIVDAQRLELNAAPAGARCQLLPQVREGIQAVSR